MQTTTYAEINLGFSGLNALLRIATLLLLFAFTGTQPVMAASTDMDDEARLKRGEILLETIHTEQSGGAARVTALFHTNVDAIWDIIGYYKYEFIYVRGLESCGVLIPGLQYIRKHHRINNSWYMPTVWLTILSAALAIPRKQPNNATIGLPIRLEWRIQSYTDR